MGFGSWFGLSSSQTDTGNRLLALAKEDEAAAAADPTAVEQPKKTKSTTPTVVEQVAETTVDRRARLRPKPGASTYVYGDVRNNGLLSILRQTNGLVFPNTPTISETHAVSYSQYSPTHSIAKFNSYDSTENVSLQVAGDFFVTNVTEAQYLLACIHFLRSVTKMDFGRTSKTAGTPPPVLLFSAYGNFMYNDVPVIIKAVNFTLEPDIDYIQVPLIGEKTDFKKDINEIRDFFNNLTVKSERVWVPQKLTISMTLEQQTTGEWLTNNFNLEEFKRGDLLTKGGLI